MLRVGSVIGMTFREPMVEEIARGARRPAVYERLAEAAMIVPTDAIGGWRFCHPLIHDAAYRSLLATDRTVLHTRVADRLEARQPDRLVGTIARHRAAAGDAVRAIPLLLRAAEQAAGSAAPTEAAGYLETAAGLEPDPDGSRAELRRRADGGTRRSALRRIRRAGARRIRDGRPGRAVRSGRACRRQLGRHAGRTRRTAAGPWPTSMRRPGPAGHARRAARRRRRRSVPAARRGSGRGRRSRAPARSAMSSASSAVRWPRRGSSNSELARVASATKTSAPRAAVDERVVGSRVAA